MYNVGDKVVYPMFGACVIESIEEREVLGRRQFYYQLKSLTQDMKVMIPIDNVSVAGVREVIDSDSFDKVISIFKKHAEIDNNTDWDKRYRENMLKIKSGNIFEVADFVKSLMIRQKEKGLSMGEKMMLMRTKEILISELVLAKKIEHKEVESMINDLLTQ